MLEVRNLTKKFEEIVAVDDISFNVEPGKIFGLVGRNGAGKSTTFRVILKILDATDGVILYNGEKINQNILDKIGFLPEEGSLIATYTVLELCQYYGSLKLMSYEEIRKNLIYWLQEFNIVEFLNKKIKDLSKGNRQKIQFIISVLHDPEILILDEPFSGLDPVSVEELKNAILKMKEQNKTIIFSSHRMEHVEKLCEDILLLEKGKALLQGNVKDIIENYEINGKKGNSLNDIFIDKVGESNE